jgi:hypothetical protein
MDRYWGVRVVLTSREPLLGGRTAGRCIWASERTTYAFFLESTLRLVILTTPNKLNRTWSDPFGTVLQAVLMRNWSAKVHSGTFEQNGAAEIASDATDRG